MIGELITDWLHADCQDEAARLRAHIQRLTGLCHDREVQLGEHHVLVERCKDLEAQVRALEMRRAVETNDPNMCACGHGLGSHWGGTRSGVPNRGCTGGGKGTPNVPFCDCDGTFRPVVTRAAKPKPKPKKRRA